MNGKELKAGILLQLLVLFLNRTEYRMSGNLPFPSHFFNLPVNESHLPLVVIKNLVK
jgi:hypothetical protein